MIIWLTGLSGSGKSTLSRGLAQRLQEQGIQPLIIDGDELRAGLCSDLSFSLKDRAENIRRAGAMAILASRSGITSICALISPLRSARENIRSLCLKQNVSFFEIYLNASLATCENRDPKNLYKAARSGGLSQFTGIDCLYEPPINPELVIPTAQLTVDESLDLMQSALNIIR